ncbi:MAG: primosomal protein N' [Xanthomonadales bacterium]|nr:primosomal protein N' [Xanthomonadales bacterium]
MNPPALNPYLRVALPLPLADLFDYRCPEAPVEIPLGTRVLVPFGNADRVGLVCGYRQKSDLPESRILSVRRVLDEGKPLLNGELVALLRWCATYYRHPPGEVYFNALPPALRKRKGRIPAEPVEYCLTRAGSERLELPVGKARRQYELLEMASSGPLTVERLRAWSSAWTQVSERLVEQGWLRKNPGSRAAIRAQQGPTLTAEQSVALAAISADLGKFRCHLLDGVTGSGKTEVYLRLIVDVLKAGRQALVLVPEIGLTPQLIRRFSERLGLQPAVYHSGLSEGERLRTWADARSGRARLLLGTRSALFLPLPEPGLIIMDESHDASFKQQDGFRFSARDVAVKRASDLGVPVVLGTATPSLESLRNAQRGRYGWNRLRQRASGAKQPRWQVQDMRTVNAKHGLSEPVTGAIAATLERGEQVLVFLNRRGYAPVLLCHECGWHASCRQCDANMTWHRNDRVLICHHCTYRQPVPHLCPDCRADALQGAGEGTQQLEQLLGQRFDSVPLYRFDRDQFSRKGSFEAMTGEVRKGQPCILVGTQMLAKGHHFPAVTLVVVLSLDQAFYSADFRATERMGQLLIQVAGRAGRAQSPGTVIMQTHHPDHPLLETLVGEGYEAFATALLEERRLAKLPPFSFQAVLRAEAAKREAVQAMLERAAACCVHGEARVHGPFPALMERRGGRVRWYLLLQSETRSGLQQSLGHWLPQVSALPEARRVRWSVDVDPQEF